MTYSLLIFILESIFTRWTRCLENFFLENVNSRSRLLNAVVRPSVCRLSVTFVRPTQPVEILGNISKPFGTLAIC